MVLDDVSFQFIREITDNFSEERILGEGTFGVVYKGVTKDGLDVAVKKLKPCLADLDNKQFRNEFDTLRKLDHQNIVKFLGYCYETEKKPSNMTDGTKVFLEEIHTALCFEYLHNGSLQRHLSDESSEVKFDWHMWFKIIKGICEGLKYMHNDLEGAIYHFDLKPDNILLDKDMVPKIADFGLSRIFGQDIIRTTHSAYGTPGYQPPEYIDRGEISGKFDIFSLGAVIKRIVSRPMGYLEYSDNMSSDEFIDQVHEKWRKKLHETCSCSDSLLEAYCRQIETCTQIALNCLDEDSQKRPDIVNITEKLNGIEVSVGKLPEEGRGISKMIVQNNSTEMREKSRDITVPHQNTNPLSSTSCSKLEHIDERETSTDVVEEFIVGREEEKGTIITSLLDSPSKQISILPIHGIGGIGKTTFSRLIYNDLKFECYWKAWVHVSHRFDLKKIRESINSQVSEKENQSNERHVVHSSPTKLLPGKKIMIVLDDLWEDNQFQLNDLKDMLYHDLKDMLYHDDSKTIILVTTRSESVAKRIWENLQPYRILPLTNGMCWDIIKQRSGFGARDDKEKLRGIGQEIAEKCAGVALAAQSLGFTLRGKNFDHWMKVKDNDIWKEHISKDISLPNNVLVSLKLSYSYMDPCLKLCFTYCAIFPKGHWIVKSDLIYQWISLDLIKPTKLLSVMDLCKKYIMQLQGLSFIQESPKSAEAYSEKATIFVMHDLVHDLAISLLGNNILYKSKQENTMGKIEDYHRYAVFEDCSMPRRLTSVAELIALRFLTCRGTELHSSAFALATSLRVLDFSECYIPKLPDSIGQLKQLRYLSAPGVRDREFLECITKLSHLIFLNLHGSEMIHSKHLMHSVSKMKDLMHLDLSGCNIWRLPDSFMRLEKLVHLDFSGSSVMLLESSKPLGTLSRLEHLSLSQCHIYGDLAKVLCGLTELHYLDLSKIHFSRSRNLCTGLQHVLDTFTKLRYLNVCGVLDTRSAQQVLEADTEAFIGAITSVSSLEYLNLGRNECLYNIPKTIGSLGNLCTLDLSNCVNLQSLPAAISGMDNLKCLRVVGCDNLDKSTLPLYKNVAVLLPYFVVHARDSESSSNLCHLENENPTKLEMSGLENVKSTGEAQRIKLVEKQRIKELGLVWTRDAKRFVDKDVLEQLVPPCTVERMRLQGYSSAGFPSWMMDIATYVPQLVHVTLEDMPNCSRLPPLGQLPKLQKLRIGRMDSIRKIGQDLYGDGGFIQRMFPRLESFELQEMKCLEEWNMSYSYPSAGGEDASNKELTFPKLEYLVIAGCPKLRFESLSPLAEQTPPLPLGKNMTIIRPPCTVERMRLQGYSSAGFASWMMDIATYAPQLVHVTLEDMPNCSRLPPLGQLPKLQKLRIGRMDSIRKIGQDLYGDGGFIQRMFPRLESFELQEMKCLEEWNMSYSYPSAGGEDASNKELTFPKLEYLVIAGCPKLRFESLSPLAEQTPPLPLGKNMTIIRPPCTVERMRLQGYSSTGFASWMMDIATYAPQLVHVTLEDMPNCSRLPPLGQLPKLQKLRIGRMDSIRKIGQDLYGDGGFIQRMFPRLESFELQEMKCLEEWNMSYSYPSAGGEDASNKELTFPKLEYLVIAGCPMLRFESLSPLAEQTPPLPLGKNMTIIRSHWSSWKCSARFDAVTSSEVATWLCEAPLHQWSLLRHLPFLKELRIEDCSDLTCSSTDLLRCVPSSKTLSVRDCKSIAALPERLGDLTSLEELQISNCEGIKTLPESIQQLARLQRLKINGCPQLVQLRWPPSLQILSVNNCKSIVQLPQRLGDLSSLKNLEIIDCEGVKALPENIQQLTCLQFLKIYGCPQLSRWCRSEENKMKLAHIKTRVY